MITISNLTKNYQQVEVLKGITAQIDQGEIVSIIGASGQGKSTLLRCLNGLEQPTSGSIMIDNEKMNLQGDQPWNGHKMGMVFQNFNLFNHLTVIENVMIGQTTLLKRDKERAQKEAMNLLKSVGLAEKANSMPNELSGGEKQRVAIARCLSVEPSIILFDEPTSALDPTMVNEVLTIIKRLANHQITMIIVTHEMQFAKEISTRIFFMSDGVIYEEGTPEQIFDHPQREKTRYFINQIKSFNYRLNSPDYDFLKLNRELYLFCHQNNVEKKLSNKVVLVIEELLQLIPVTHGAHIEISYTEKSQCIEGRLVQFQCQDYYLKESDDTMLSLAIIKGTCSYLNEEIDEQNSTICFKLS